MRENFHLGDQLHIEPISHAALHFVGEPQNLSSCRVASIDDDVGVTFVHLGVTNAQPLATTLVEEFAGGNTTLAPRRWGKILEERAG